MADDRKRRVRYRDYARAPSAVPEPFDEDKTPLPTTMDEAFGWQHVDRRLVAVEAAVKGITPDITRHEQSLTQWSGAVQECLVDIAAASQRLEAIESSLGRDWQRFSGALDDVTKAVADLGAALGERMGKLEVGVANVVAMQASQAALIAQIDRRVTEVERDKAADAGASTERVRIFRLAHGVVIAGAGIAGFLANHFFG